MVYNARVYDQLRLQSADVSSYANLGRWVTDVSVLYYDSDSQTTNQAIGYTRCCGQAITYTFQFLALIFQVYFRSNTDFPI